MLVDIELSSTECCVCGVVFAIPKIMLDHKIKKGGYIHCPSGHSIGWGEGKVERNLRLAEQDLDGYRKRNASLSSEVSSLEASNRGLRAANTRLKKKKKGK